MFLFVVLLIFSNLQTKVVNKVFDDLRENKQVNFTVKKVKVGLFGGIHIQDILIKDHHQDSLIFIADLKASIDQFSKIDKHHFFIKNVKLKDAFLHSIKYDGEKKSSLSVFIDRMSPEKKSKEKLNLFFKNIQAKNINYTETSNHRKIINYHQIHGKVERLNIIGSDINLTTSGLAFKDIYGVNYQKLATNFNYTTHRMTLENTSIKTDYSKVNGNVVFNYVPGDFSDFVTKVKVNAFFDKSLIDTQDIQKFYTETPMLKAFDFTTKVSGTLNNLHLTNLDLVSKDSTVYVNGDMNLKNTIRNRDQLLLTSDEITFKTIGDQIEDLVPCKYQNTIPQFLHDIKKMSYVGNIQISTKNITNTGYLRSDVLNTDVISNVNYGEQITFDVKTANSIVKQNKWVKKLGFAKFDITSNGKMVDDKLYLKSSGRVGRFKYQDITLLNTVFDIDYNPINFHANIKTDDELLKFSSSVEKKNIEDHEVYQIHLDLNSAKLNKLFPNQIHYQSDINAKGVFMLNTRGKDLNLSGNIDGLTIKTIDNDSVVLNKTQLSYLNRNENKRIRLLSKKALALSVDGYFEFLDLEKLVSNAINKFIPGNKNREGIEDQSLKFSLTVAPGLLKTITNEISIENKFNIKGDLSSDEDKGTLQATIPNLIYNKVRIDSLLVNLDNSNQFINTNIKSKQISYGKQVYNDVNILGKKINDTLYVRSNLKSDNIQNVSTFYVSSREDHIDFGIEEVKLNYLKSQWANKINSRNKITYNYIDKTWEFEDLKFINEKQILSFNGHVENHQKKLQLGLKNVDLTHFLPKIDSLAVSGIATGKINFIEQDALLQPEGNLDIKNFKINDIYYGNLISKVKPTQIPLEYKVDLKIEDASFENMNASGLVKINQENFADSNLDLSLALAALKLNSISPLGKDILSKIKGEASGKINVKGALNDLNFYGDLYISKAGLNIPYLNTNYDLAEKSKVVLSGKKIEIKNVGVKDVKYNTNGKLFGEVTFDNKNNWFLDLNIAAKDLLALDTEFDEESKYYGTAFFNGLAEIKGFTNDLKINITGTTLKDTHFVLPLSDVVTAEENKLIHFKAYDLSGDDENKKGKNKKSDSSLEIALNIEVTKDALGEVVIDQVSGSSLSGRTNGRLLVEIDKFFNIKMFGDLTVDSGIYNYKYGNVINKPFSMKKGGTISWDGDPYQALLNIEAEHKVKANPKVLLESLSVNRKIDVNLSTIVTGPLFDSKQAFDISLPNVSSNVAQELDFVINIDKDTKLRQFFSLLVSKSFFDENSSDNTTSSVLSSTTSEIITRAVTDIFNKDGDKFQIGFGYTAGENSDIESIGVDDQIDIDLATQINDRILINGRLGVPVGSSTQSTLLGEVNIEILLNKQGTSRWTVFNRQNEIQFSQDEQGYTQGTGWSYQLDFSNLKELLQKIKRNKSAVKEEELIENVSD